MSLKSSRIAKVVALTLVAVVGAAVMTALNRAGEPVADVDLGQPAVSPASCDRGPETSWAGVAHTADMCQDEVLLEPAAICRLLPECDANSDCDEKCGIGQGKCAHSRCPVRVCRCR
jgi:hypothetical protein